MSDNEHRRSDDPSCHYMGCSCSILYVQHWQTSEVFDSFRSAEELAVSTFRPAGEVDVDFRANSQARGSEPTIICIAWKSKRQKKQKRQKIVKISFGASPIGNRNARKQIINLRQEVDLESHHLFPRDANGNLKENQELWKFGNCAETNAWFHVASQRPELPIRTHAIETMSQEMREPCSNWQMIIEHSTPEICPHLLSY